jgi:hypothetical protein
MKLRPSTRTRLFILALVIPCSLYAEGGPSGAAPADQAGGSLSIQAQSEIENEGVLGALGAGVDTPADTVVAYQVGAFRIRATAERLIEELGKADFVGYLYTKRVDASDYWVVLVSAANNPFENRSNELSEAGFASIPILKSELDASLKLAPGQ